MKILFVRPRPAPETIGLQHVMLVEPLELEVLAACVGEGDTPVIVDMILERKPFAEFVVRERPDVVCVTGYLTSVPGIIDCCETAKRLRPQVTTVVGGVHCEVCPGDLSHPAIDFRVVRNATTVFAPLLAHLRGDGPLPPGVLRPGDVAASGSLPPFDFTFPIPRRELTARYRKDYFYIFHHRVALIKTSFGCPHRCQFCFCHAITGGGYAQRPLDEVMRELDGIAEREIYIVDDDFLADRKRVCAFIEENRRRQWDKHYLIYGRADFIARNPEVMAEFRAVGLRTVIVGLESFFDDELTAYHKGNDAATNREALAVLRRLQIDCFATIIVSPEWGTRQFTECARLFKSLGLHYVNLQPLTPLPGTGFIVPDEELVLSRQHYTRWDLAHVSVRPRQLSVAECYRHMLALYQAILFQPPVLWGYLRRYTPAQCWKLLVGSLRVRRQYLRKIREAERSERDQRPR